MLLLLGCSLVGPLLLYLQGLNAVSYEQQRKSHIDIPFNSTFDVFNLVVKNK